MKRYLLLLCTTFVLNIYAQKINWNNIGPFPKEERGEIVLYNIEGEKCSDVLYDRDSDYRHFFYTESSIVPIKENGLWGWVNREGKQIVPCKYNRELWPFQFENETCVCVTNETTGLIGVLNAYGETVVPFEYNDIKTRNNPGIMSNLFIVQKEGKWGAVNKQGKIVIPIIHDKPQHSDVDKGIVFFEKGNKWGGYDEYGNNVLPFIFNYTADQPTEFKDFSIVQALDKTWFLCDKKGKMKKLNIDANAELWTYPDDKLLIVKEGKWDRLFDIESNKYVSPFFDQICLEYKNKFVADIRTANGYTSFIINDKGKRLFTHEYDHCHALDYGYIKAEKNGKFGIIDYNDRIIVPFEYDDFNDVSALTPNLFSATQNGKTGIIDLNNRVVVDYIYDDIRMDKETGLLEVMKGDKYSFLDDKYKLAVPWVNDRLNLGMEKYRYLYSIEKSDVDENVPYNSIRNDNTYVVIIANENYTENNISKVQFARNDGKSVREYCTQTLGIPLKNIKYIEDGTLNNIRSAISWVGGMVKTQEKRPNVIFYYTGHGMPDEETKNAYILPSDGIANDYQSGYSLELLYKQLGDLPTAQTIVLIDACFSGTSREGQMMLADSKGVVIKSNPVQPEGNMIVMAASQGDETAHLYKKKKHGLFTYFLLKKLQETHGNASLGDLETYVTKKVSQQSLIEKGRPQTPSVSVSNSLNGIWKSLKLY